MDRRKNVAPDSLGGYREFTKWTTKMDLIMLNAMIEEVCRGCRIDGSWTTKGYTNIVMALHEVGLSAIKKNHVKNRHKSLKDRWREVHDLFGGLNGFAWNQTTLRFEVEDEVWNDMIKAKPSAAKWCVNPIRHHNLMEELWSNDRVTGSRVRTTRDINSPPDIIIALYMASSSHKRHITNKGKTRAEDLVVPPPPATGIEEVLDYSRYFSTKRKILLCILHFFVALGFEFQNFLNSEVLQPFLGMKLPYYEDLVRLFYTNVKITPIGHLAIEICRRRIHINQLDWMNIANLKYDGVKLTPGTIPEEMVYILCPHGSNFAQLLNEDIFMLWLIKNNVMNNWPHYIMQHMIKCRDNNMPLPYGILITRILQ
ncbi:hypothetical protein PHAVU_002G097600, partial [Phaseolus vulgaris]